MGWVQIQIDDSKIKGIVFYEGCTKCLKRISGDGHGAIVRQSMRYRDVLRLTDLNRHDVNFFLTATASGGAL